MFEYKLKKLPKNTFEVLMTIPKNNIDTAFEQAFERLAQRLEVEGFRKGKAPKDIAKKHLKKEDIYQEVIRELLPKAYQDIITKEKLQPLVNPKIELVKAKEKEDWLIKFSIADKPKFDLKDYKITVRNAKAKFKQDDIWIPGKSKNNQTNEEEKKQKTLNEILNALLKENNIEISDLVIEDELNRRLSQLLDDIKKIGLTVENYLKTKNVTMDELKKRYLQEINDTYKLEFILQEIADKQGIRVEKEDLDKLFTNLKDDKDKKIAEQNAYFYASVLRKQKTLDYLLSL